MPAEKQPVPEWKAYPEPEFPYAEDREAYRQARKIIRDAWLRMQAGEAVKSLGGELFNEHLTALPPEIGQLTALTELQLWKNELTALPPEIGQLTMLTELNLADNQLTVLPPEMGRLTALTRLYLEENQLMTLPPETGQLTALTMLNLADNHLTALPRELRNLTRLEQLYLHGNTALRLDLEVLGPTWQEVEFEKKTPARPQDIFDYYFRTSGQSGS